MTGNFIFYTEKEVQFLYQFWFNLINKFYFFDIILTAPSLGYQYIVHHQS